MLEAAAQSFTAIIGRSLGKDEEAEALDRAAANNRKYAVFQMNQAGDGKNFGATLRKALWDCLLYTSDAADE